MNGPVHVGPIAAVASRLALGLLLCLSMFATSAQARRLALVIGNDSYQQVSKLDKAVNDAEGMAVELTRAGFEVNKHRDLTFRKTVLAFEEFYDKVKGGDEVVVFYAGHGVQTERGSYLLPVDIEGETISQIEKISYSVNNLLEELDRIKARFSLIIVDACRDNPLRSRGRTIGVARGLNAPDVAKGQMVIFSAGRGQKALDSLNDRDRHPNGVFTRELIARMQTPGLSVEKLAVEVKGAVEKLAATVNHDQRPLIVNDSTGEFFFYPPAGSRPGDASRTTASQAPLSEAAREDRFWEDAKAPDNAEGYEAYLSQYANGRYAGLARANLSRLSARSGADPGSQATTRNSAAPAVSAAPGAGVPAPQSSRPSQAANPGTGPATSPEPPVVLAAARPRPEPTPVPAPSPAAAPQPASSPVPVPAAGGKPGRASYTLANGDRYEGEVVGNVRSGQGVYQFANGDRYQGTFVDGVSNGRGVMSFANGDRYEGGFIGTTKQGAGVMEFANKDRYEGEFADNLYHGKGSFTFATGERYTGDYVRGLKQGRGVYVFASGDKYEGPFDNDVSHGKGSTTFANGDHFEGEFVKGIKQGPGIFRFANGDRYEGRFVDGLFNGKGRLSLASGDVYEGEFRNNVKDGVGTHLFASKDRYEGQFRDGAQSGTGTHFFANGDRYVGEFANGLRHGKGVYRFASGQTREMDYVQGVEKAP